VKRHRKVTDTSDRGYTDRLVTLESVWWKRLLNVNAPYQWNIRRLHLGRTLEIGCGIGRNLESLGDDSIGIDHNEASVTAARARGHRAYTTEEFLRDFAPSSTQFDSLLIAHVIEHVDAGTARELVMTYLAYLKPRARVAFITPQEAGYKSDASHVAFTDFDALEELAKDLGLSVIRRYSFPFPRPVGKLFKYNEFVVVALR
jgi:2-polyprenyl-3-methyl-5-hydroxy-6-metoxy-1,4-benzoquinol methylase